MTKTLINKHILVVHENFEQTIDQKQIKNNTECVYKHSNACSGIKRLFFSQEILGEERIPPGSHEENNALMCVLVNFSLICVTFAPNAESKI